MALKIEDNIKHAQENSTERTITQLHHREHQRSFSDGVKIAPHQTQNTGVNEEQWKRQIC
jgi:hypothetical protein